MISLAVKCFAGITFIKKSLQYKSKKETINLKIWLIRLSLIGAMYNIKFMFFAILLFSYGLKAQNYSQKIFPLDPRTGVFFGRYIAMNDDDAFISAYLDYENGTASGSMYIFSLSDNRFNQVAKKFPVDGAVEDYFSYSVSSSGDYLITGAHHDSDKGASSGAAYILKKTGSSWDFYQKIVPDDGKEADEFGKTVAISGNYAVVCSYLDDDNGTNSGSIYLLELKNEVWKIINKIYPSDPEIQSLFGLSLDMNNDLIIAGSPFYRGNGNSAGKAYIFRYDSLSWLQVAALQPDEINDLDQFGTSVRISDNFAFISAIKDDDKGENSGAVYIYKKKDENTWAFHQKVTAPDGSAGDGFGIAITGNDTILIIGSYFDDDNGTNSGSAYIFKNLEDQWIYFRKLIPTDSDESDAFGSSLAFNKNGLLVGAYSDDDNGFFSGAVYYFSKDDYISKLNTVNTLNVLVYPTIVKEQLNILIPTDLLPSKYRICDMNGRILSNGRLFENRMIIDLKFFKSGVYFLEISDGRHYNFFKILKTQ